MQRHELLELYRQRLTALAASKLGWDDAEDAVQEAYIRIELAVANAVVHREIEHPYLYKVVHSVCTDFLRKRKRQVHASLDVILNAIPDRLIDNDPLGQPGEFINRIDLSRLTGRQREACEMYLSGMRNYEIADAVGVEHGAMGKMLQRAFAQLRLQILRERKLMGDDESTEISIDALMVRIAADEAFITEMEHEAYEALHGTDE